MTVWQSLNALERLGYGFELAGDSVRATLQGAPSPQASALLAIVRQDRDAARAYVQARQAGATVADDGCTYPLFDALAIAQAVRKGEARLLGKVTFDRRSLTARVLWEPTHKEASAACLKRWQEWLKNALQARLEAMEATDYWNLTAEDYNRFCAQYGRYTMILEGVSSYE